MDSETFTETFFNTYKSFTTTVDVLASLAKRYIGAKSCAYSIEQIVDTHSENKTNNEYTLGSSLLDSEFPVWDNKVQDDANINLIYMAKIQIGAAEAIFHLIKNHYADFTDDLTCNTTFLDILKIMEQEVTIEWPTKVSELKSSTESSEEQIAEIELHVKTLLNLFEGIKSSYQKQVYRPTGVSKIQRKVIDELKAFNNISLTEFSKTLKSSELNDSMVADFQKLKYNDYTGIMEWVYLLDKIIAEKLKLVTKHEWFIVIQELELVSHKSLVAFFSYPSHVTYNNQMKAGSFQLKDLEIQSLFTWISTLTLDGADANDVLLMEKLPKSVQLVIKLHNSLSTFFVTEIASLEKTYRERLQTCSTILQILNYARWKNGFLDLFQSTPAEENDSICPHIPSFIETALSEAIMTPESRYFEHSWKMAHSMLCAPHSNPTLRNVTEILENIDVKHLKSFVELDSSFLSTRKNLSPCIGWFISRLQEISQFVPNMSISNSKLINFDKRRFTNNIIANVLDLIPYTDGKDLEVNFGKSLFNNYEDINKS